MFKSIGADHRWGLSGTPPVGDTAAISQVADILWYPAHRIQSVATAQRFQKGEQGGGTPLGYHHPSPPPPTLPQATLTVSTPTLQSIVPASSSTLVYFKNRLLLSLLLLLVLLLLLSCGIAIVTAIAIV